MATQTVPDLLQIRESTLGSVDVCLATGGLQNIVRTTTLGNINVIPVE